MSGYGLAYSLRGYAGKRVRPANYSNGPGAMPDPKHGPCAWEKFLLGLGLSERDALELIGSVSPEWASISAWVLDNGHKLFAPEEILSALGMGE